ncbi:MAG: ATP phosphoribosyltransferase [Rhodobacteraceae bacterium]|nr:ATP phosphoribosyltransferase [Paracoccaceae bacterium]
MTMSPTPLIIAVPKGRILSEVLPILNKAGIEPEPAFADEDARQLQFATNAAHVSLIRVRSFDVATFVAFGAAQLGICGNDVLMEFDYSEIYAPLDLGIGKCRLSIAQPKDLDEGLDLSRLSHVRIATKYPETTSRWFAEHGIQAECVKLNGAMELAPVLGLSPRIVDLVSTGNTLKANGLVEVATIAEVTSRLIVNRTALKVRPAEINAWIERLRKAVE